MGKRISWLGANVLILGLALTYGTDLERPSPRSTVKLPQTTLKTLDDFLQGNVRDGHFLEDAGGKVGVFAITGLGSDFSGALETFRANAPKCLENFDSHLPVSKMSDGSSRRTYATQEKIYPGCLSMPLTTMSAVYDTVESKVTSLIQKLQGDQKLSYTVEGETVALQASPVKDHLHVYTKSSSEVSDGSSKYLVPYHIDNGLFLIITPFPSPSLLVKLSNGQSISTSGLGSDSVLILMGLGLTDWLLQDEPSNFYPVAHAVPSMKESHSENRPVFARMKVAPQTAVPVTKTKTNLKTFGDVFFGAPTPKEQNNEDLCWGSVAEQSYLLSLESSPPTAAFFKSTIKNCNNQTDAYCWMNCLPLPHDCTLEESECYNAQHQQCNTYNEDPPHDVTCAWHCKPVTTPSPPGPTPTPPGPTPPPPQDEFCQGGMDMLMGGFEVAGGPNSNSKTCVILFFKEWKLNTAGKFAGACFGVFFLGFSIELLIALRRRIVNRKRLFINLPLPVRKITVIALFGINLVLGYLAMLVAMTYSVELFICVVVGFIVGHALLNSHMPVGETIDPCCATQNQNESVGERSPISHNELYQEMAANGSAQNDGDTHSNCHCEDATSNTNIKL